MMIFEKVRDALASQFEIDPEKITLDTNLVDDLGADSLDTVELIMEFEKEFNITIPDDVAEKISTVQDAIDYIKANVQ